MAGKAANATTKKRPNITSQTRSQADKVEAARIKKGARDPDAIDAILEESLLVRMLPVMLF